MGALLVPRGRRLGVAVLAAAGWVAVVSTVSLVSWAAIDSAGRQVGAAAPPVARAVAATPGSLGASTPGATSLTATHVTDGGRVAVACDADGARLRWASPAQGWRVERREMLAHGPVRVDFIGGGREIVVRARCGAAGATFDVVEEVPPGSGEGLDDD